MLLFERYLGIDYSGAETATSSLKGLRLYAATPGQPPAEIPPPPSPRKYWTRRGLAEWLAAELTDGPPTLVGIDHAFSFPLRYFEVHRLTPDWPAFLDDFRHHWPTDDDNMYVDFIRSCALPNARWPSWKAGSLVLPELPHDSHPTTPDRGQSGATDGLGGRVGNATRRLPRHSRQPLRSPRRRTHGAATNDCCGPVSGYETLLNRGHSRISINTAAGGDPPTIDHQVAAIARELSRGTPPSRRVRVTGRLELMGASQGVPKPTKRSWPR